MCIVGLVPDDWPDRQTELLECRACNDLWFVSPWAMVNRDNYVCPDCEEREENDS